MEKISTAFSLRWKILAWFFVNLALLGGVLFLFLRVQFHVGINSLLAGSTSDRLEAIARPLAAELRQRPSQDWDTALDRAVSSWRAKGLRAAIFRDNGRPAAGDFRTIPPEVLSALVQHAHRPPGPPPGGRQPQGFGNGSRGQRQDRAFGERENSRPGGDEPPGDFADFMGMPDFGPVESPNADNVRRALERPAPTPDSATSLPLEKFMLMSASPRLYWAGVSLGEVHGIGPGGPPSFTLLMAADSLRGGGLFFDYVPWLALGGILLLVSVLMWLPFVHGLTRALARMTHTAEEIAQGHFEPPHVSARRDELGRLNRALGHMAARLEGFVTGQKRFLGDTAHELLSPLARLEVALSILEQRAGSSEENGYAERALDEVRHISSLVHDLLSFTKTGFRPPDSVLQSVPLAQLACEAVKREAAETHVRVDVAAELCVCADPDLLVRALAKRRAQRGAIRRVSRANHHRGCIEPRRRWNGCRLGDGVGSRSRCARRRVRPLVRSILPPGDGAYS